jgi:glutamate-ammonia-ligase adenylyltransferase
MNSPSISLRCNPHGRNHFTHDQRPGCDSHDSSTSSMSSWASLWPRIRASSSCFMATPDPHGAALGLLRVVEAAGHGLRGAAARPFAPALRRRWQKTNSTGRCWRACSRSWAPRRRWSTTWSDILIRCRFCWCPNPFLLISTPAASAVSLRAEPAPGRRCRPRVPGTARHRRPETRGSARCAGTIVTPCCGWSPMISQPKCLRRSSTTSWRSCPILPPPRSMLLWRSRRAEARRGETGSACAAVIALGKTGARELNYVSDVDVVFVLDSAARRRRAGRLATDLAQRTRAVLSDAGGEPALWEVDTALRPEGKAGALVRTLSEFEHYYADTAQNWEVPGAAQSSGRWPVMPKSADGSRTRFCRLVWKVASRDRLHRRCQIDASSRRRPHPGR